MKIWIHQTHHFPTMRDLVKNYPALNEYKLTEKTDKYKNVKPYISLSSLKEIVDLSHKINHPIIIEDIDNEPSLEIYDDWRE